MLLAYMRINMKSRIMLYPYEREMICCCVFTRYYVEAYIRTERLQGIWEPNPSFIWLLDNQLDPKRIQRTMFPRCVAYLSIIQSSLIDRMFLEQQETLDRFEGTTLALHDIRLRRLCEPLPCTFSMGAGVAVIITIDTISQNLFAVVGGHHTPESAGVRRAL